MGLKKYIAKKLQNAIGINELKAEIDALHQRVEKKTDALACQTEKIEKKQAETTAKMQDFSGQTQAFSNQLQDFSSQVQDCNGQVRAFSNQVQTLQTSSSQKFDRVNTDNHNIIGKLSNTEKAYGELKRDVARAAAHYISVRRPTLCSIWIIILCTIVISIVNAAAPFPRSPAKSMRAQKCLLRILNCSTTLSATRFCKFTS